LKFKHSFLANEVKRQFSTWAIKCHANINHMLMAVEGSSWLSREVTGKNKQEKNKQHLKVSIFM